MHPYLPVILSEQRTADALRRAERSRRVRDAACSNDRSVRLPAWLALLIARRVDLGTAR